MLIFRVIVSSKLESKHMLSHKNVEKFLLKYREILPGRIDNLIKLFNHEIDPWSFLAPASP